MDHSVDIYIPLTVLTDEELLALQILQDEEHIDMEVSPTGSGNGTYDYQELINKPTINGTELFDNYDEIDPTVHEWAKEPIKPAYTAEEVGAIDEDNEVPFADLLSAWRDVFG